MLVRTGLSTPGTGADPGSSAAGSSGISLLDNMLTTFLNNAATGLPLAALIVASGTALLISLHRKSPFWSPGNIMASVFILAALTHMAFGHTGHFFRYEAYLVAIGLFVSACIIPEVTAAPAGGLAGTGRKRIVMTVLALSSVPALFLLTSRSMTSLEQTPIAGRNIYEQQYQMGLFLQRYYPDDAVVLNDIGAVSFLTRVRLLDLVGLANIDVLRLKRAGEYDAGHIQALCRQYGAGIAIVYDSWLRRVDSRGGPLPWTKVGEWRIHGNVICSDDVVSLYAVQDSEREALLRNLRSHSSRLPENVVQTGPYTEESIPDRR